MSNHTVRLGRVLTGSRSNGPGLRDVYWTTGCSIRCPGCINPHYLEAGTGVDVELSAILELIQKRRNDIEGISFSGGEPTDQAVPVSHICAFARSLGLSVVVFTGRTKMECERHAVWQSVLAHCDILVAGRFEAEHRRRTQPLLGSANQQVHFLTSRYGEADLLSIPDVELKIAPDIITVTGVYVPATVRPLDSEADATHSGIEPLL